MDTINLIAELKAAHENSSTTGINVFLPVNLLTWKKLVLLNHLGLKTQAIKAASEAAEMILRIDDMIAAKKCIKLSRS